jgi:hypothetical protein
LPIRRDKVGLIVQNLDVGHLIEGDHVGLETVQNGAGLLR